LTDRPTTYLGRPHFDLATMRLDLAAMTARATDGRWRQNPVGEQVMQERLKISMPGSVKRSLP